jgi:hypothetical protein
MLQRSRSLSVFLGSLCLSATLGAAVPAYEPFAYNPAPTPVNGKNGGTGWGGPWVGFADNVVAPGLTYPGLSVSGNALGPTPGSASTRALAAPIVGASGTSMVLSALIRSTTAGTPASQATLGNSSGGTFTLGDLPMPDAAAGNWGLETSAGRFYSNVPVAANATTYLVAQIDFNVSGNNDRMRLWVNPPGNAYFTANPNVDVTSADVGQFSGVFWQTQQQQVVDEIRVSSTNSACVLPPNTTMVGWYPFDETSGPLALNLATANDGAHLGNPTPVPGMVAGALSFDGIDDYVESPSSIVTNFGPATTTAACSGSFSTCPGDFSFDAWIQVLSPVTTNIIVDKRLGNIPTLRGYSFFLYFPGSLGLQLADGLGTGFSNYLSPTLTPAIDDGHWHHVAITVKRTNAAGIRFYHNGNLVGTANPLGRKGSLVNNSPLRIGTRTAASPLSGWFDGAIDELEIFNRVLTPVEVKALFSAGPFGKCK